MPAPNPAARPPVGRAAALVADGPVLPSSLRRVLSSGEPPARGAWARTGWSLALVVIVGGGLVLWQLLMPVPVGGGDVFLGPPMAPARPRSTGPGAAALIVGGPDRDALRAPLGALHSSGKGAVTALAALHPPAPRPAGTGARPAPAGREARSSSAAVSRSTSGAGAGRRTGPARPASGPDPDGGHRASNTGPGGGRDAVADHGGKGRGGGQDAVADHGGKGPGGGQDADAGHEGKAENAGQDGAKGGAEKKADDNKADEKKADEKKADGKKAADHGGGDGGGHQGSGGGGDTSSGGTKGSSEGHG